MFLTLLARTRILMRLWSETNFRFLLSVQADSMDQETQTKVTFMSSTYCGTEARFGIRNQNQGPILVSVSEPIFFF